MSAITNNEKWFYLSAYAVAVKHGYTGTEEEWLQMIEHDAADSSAAAAASAIIAEEYAKGTKGGEAVSEDEPGYNDNSKYYSELAATSESNAADSAEGAEAWAVGERGGVPVGDTDETYHNNAKYYAESVDARLDAQDDRLDAQDVDIATIAQQVASPFEIAALVADMTDTTKAYVYTGSESGYTAGNWYYWDGSAWTSGGSAVDATLSVAGAPADAKIVGDEFKNNDEAFKSAFIAQAITNFTWEQGTISQINGGNSTSSTRVRTGYTSINMGFPNANTGISAKISVKAGYKFGIREYSAQPTASTLQSLFVWGTTSYIRTDYQLKLTPGHYYRMLIAEQNDEAITPSDVPSDVLSITYYVNTDVSLTQPYKAADAQTVGNIFSCNEMPEVEADISSLSDSKWTIIITGVWSYQSTGSGRSRVLPIPKNASRLTVNKNSNYNSYIAFLNSYNPVQNATPDYSESYPGRIILSSESATYLIPADAKYFYFQSIASTGEDIKPSKVAFTYNKAATDKTLSIKDVPADAKTVGDYISPMTATAVELDQAYTPTWEQGALNNTTGAEFDSSIRIRTKGQVRLGFDANKFTVVIPDGFQMFYREYKFNQLISKSNSRLSGTVSIYPTSELSSFRFVLMKSDDSAITPEDVPEGLTITAKSDATIKTSDTIMYLAENGSPVNLKWEQGTLSYVTGAKGEADNRIRTKFVFSADSLRYIYVHCPEGYKFGTRIYLAQSDNEYVKYLSFSYGDKLINVDGPYSYKFILGYEDDSDITVDDIPADLAIIPVYKSIWADEATGKSVGPYITARCNPTYVNQYLDIAETYYEHRADKTGDVYDTVYGQTTALDLDTYTREIDCSTFVGFVLRGIPYMDTPYYTKVPKSPTDYLASPNYVWTVNPYDYLTRSNKTDVNKSSVRTAGALGQWLVDQRREVPKDDKLVNIEPGDILFWARETSSGPLKPSRFMLISHIAICYYKKRVSLYDSTKKYALGDLVQYSDALYECTTAITTAEEWTAAHWNQVYSAWDISKYPYCHKVIEVSGGGSPCCHKDHIVERDWDNDDYTTRNNINTLVLICRPDLGSL